MDGFPLLRLKAGERIAAVRGGGPSVCTPFCEKTRKCYSQALCKKEKFDIIKSNCIIITVCVEGVDGMAARRKAGGKNATMSTVTKVFEPNIRMYLLLLVVFAAASYFLREWADKVAIVEASVILVLIVGWFILRRRRSREILEYIESVTSNIGTAAQGSLANFPLPMCVFRLSDEKLLSANDRFLKMSGGREHFFEVRVSEAVPGFPTKWLTDGRTECPDPVKVGDRTYRVYGNFVRTESGSRPGYLATTYWVDVTDLEAVRKEYNDSRPVMAVIMLDNYDELLRGMSDKDKSSLLAQVDEKISEWAGGVGGYLCKYDRDRYLFLFEERYLNGIIEQKFSILESLHSLTGYRGIPATASIGVGKDAKTFMEAFQYASLGIDMALSRGGDQAVIKNRYSFEFFGAAANQTEMRTKVKGRVMANSLSEIMRDADVVFIMGHKQSDLDCLGAEAGLVAAARKLKTTARVVIDKETSVCRDMIESLEALPEYQGVFITPDEAMTALTSASLLLVVDTNRPDLVESENLLLSCNHVGVIDHHRRAADYIQGAIFSYHEIYASSASELVTELLQYIIDQSDLTRAEAEAILAGIVLDTKNFTTRTGGGTFEAAAYLRRAGANPTTVRGYLQGDVETAVAKSRLVSMARQYREVIAIAAPETATRRVIASQAADDLCDLSGIQASFVVFRESGDTVNISARSRGTINVQLIVEKLGGGGSNTMAGAQIQGKEMEEVVTELLGAVDAYLADHPL